MNTTASQLRPFRQKKKRVQFVMVHFLKQKKDSETKKNASAS